MNELRRIEIEDWYRRNDFKIKKYLECFDELLSEGTENSYRRIAEIFENEIPIDEYKTNPEMAYMITATNIYYQESAAGVEATIFSHGKNIGEIIAIINQIRHLLWEIEFIDEYSDKETEGKIMLEQLIETTGISIYMLVEILKNASFDCYRLSRALAGYFKHKDEELYYNLICFALEYVKEYGKKDTDCNKEQPEDFKDVFLYIDGIKKSETETCDDKTIAFIMCVNNEQYMQEALYYINQLYVPEGFKLDILTVKDAKSMTSGYNEAMAATTAKYKVYLHQDVFITNKYFIFYLLRCFANPEVGLVGMVGSPKLPDTKVMWNGPRVGHIYCADAYSSTEWEIGDVSDGYADVEAVDGLLIATQYDVTWREDIFDKWDFYDVSQSFEMKRQGYRVVVPNVKRPLVLHDDGFMNLKNYYGERDKFIDEYCKEE